MPALPDLGSGPLDIVLRTAIIYVVIVVGLRFAGKGEVGQLSILDLVALLLLSNAVQNSMVGQDSSVIGGTLAAVTILALSRGLKLLAFRSRRVEKAFIGEPRILIYRGKVIESALRAEEITTTELKGALRDHGLLRSSEVRLAVLEVSGSISVIPMPEAQERYVEATDGRRVAARLGRRGRHPRQIQSPDSDEEAP
jgi:uncharacterized membrane protein YcaP (DUF421 family)